MTHAFHCDPRSVADAGDEMSIQVRLRSRMRIIGPGVKLVATPNGGKRTAWAAMKAKAEGLAKGWPDLNAVWSNGAGVNPVPGIAFLEIKDRNGSLSPDQVYWLDWLHTAGFPCGCFRSVDSAVAFLQRHGAPIQALAA